MHQNSSFSQNQVKDIYADESNEEILFMCEIYNLHVYLTNPDGFLEHLANNISGFAEENPKYNEILTNLENKQKAIKTALKRYKNLDSLFKELAIVLPRIVKKQYQNLINSIENPKPCVENIETFYNCLMKLMDDLEDEQETSDGLMSIMKTSFNMLKRSRAFIDQLKLDEDVKIECIKKLSYQIFVFAAALGGSNLDALSSSAKNNNSSLHDARAYLSEALELSTGSFSNPKENSNWRRRTYICLTIINIAEGDLDEAHYSLSRASDENKKIPDNCDEKYELVCMSLSQKLLDNSNYALAIHWLTQALNSKYITDITGKSRIEFEREITAIKIRHIKAKSECCNNISVKSDKNFASIEITFRFEIPKNLKNIVRRERSVLKIDARSITPEQIEILFDALIRANTNSSKHRERQRACQQQMANNFSLSSQIAVQTSTKLTAEVIKKETADKSVDEKKGKGKEKEKEHESKIQSTNPNNESKPHQNQQKNDQIISQATSLETKELSDAEKLGFSQQYAKFSIFPLYNPCLSKVRQYAYFDRSAAPSIDKELLNHHETQVKKGFIKAYGNGIRFVRGHNTFKTSVSSDTPHGNFRMWAQKKEEIITSDGKKELFGFDMPFDHKRQKKLYK